MLVRSGIVLVSAPAARAQTLSRARSPAVGRPAPPPSPLIGAELLLDNRHDAVADRVALVLRGGLGHDAHEGFGARRSHQNATVAAQALGLALDRRPDGRGALERLAVAHP